MSGFKVNFSVNNQLSTPSIHAAPFAQRPSAGQPGRVFIDSDNPSTGIYRDTGTVWVQIAETATSDVDTLQNVTDNGNTTTNSITVGAATSPVGTIDVRRTTAALNGANDWALVSNNNPTIASGASFGVNYVNAVYGSQAQTFAGNATIGNAGLNSAGNFINTLGNSASGTITVAQGSGTIRAIAGVQAGIYYNTPNAMTFTHVAGIKTLQPINSGAVGASVTNYYGVQIADSTPSSGTISYTNRWGIYQEGASDLNYFAGNVGVNTAINAGFRLDVNGTARINGVLQFGSQPTIESFGGNQQLKITSVLGLTISSDRWNSNTSTSSYIQNGYSVKSFVVTPAQNGNLNSFDFSASSAFAPTIAVNYNQKLINGAMTINSTAVANFFGVDSRTTDNSASIANNVYAIYGDATLGTNTSANRWAGYFVGNGYFSGNVGIGTTTPAAKLHINGTLRIDGQSSGTAGGSSGQHLIINLDGTTYKIALLNP